MVKKFLGLFAAGFVLCIVGVVGIGVLVVSGLVNDDTFKNRIRETVDIAENTAETYTTVLISEDVLYESPDDIDSISRINISMSSGYIYLCYGEGCGVSTVGIDPSDIEFDVSGGTLNVRYNPTTGISDFFDEKQVFITVPERIYEKIDVDMTAGEFVTTDIMTDELKFKISSGNAYFTNITANNSTDIEMTSGESCFSGNINNADIHVSSGDLVFNGVALTGSSDIDISSGSVVLDVIGKRSDYMIKTHRSSGMISINGTTVSGEYTETAENAAGNLGTDKINVKASSGECVITFTAPEYYAEDTENIITEYYEYSYQE